MKRLVLVTLALALVVTGSADCEAANKRCLAVR